MIKKSTQALQRVKLENPAHNAVLGQWLTRNVCRHYLNMVARVPLLFMVPDQGMNDPLNGRPHTQKEAMDNPEHY